MEKVHIEEGHIDPWDLPSVRENALDTLDSLLDDLEQHTKAADDYKNPRFVFQDIVDKLETIRENIKEEVMTKDDLRILMLSNIAGNIYNQLMLLLAYAEHHDLTHYLTIEAVKNDIDHYNNIACQLDDIARGAA